MMRGSLRHRLASSDYLLWLIVINVAVFLLISFLRIFFWAGSAKHLFDWLALQVSMPAFLPFLLKRPYSILTYFFVHIDLFHILFNMLFLYWFGRILEEFIGGKRLTALYILGGLAGGVFYFFMYNLLPPLKAVRIHTALVGASASIYAIIVGAATLRPNYTVFLLLLGPVRIKWIALACVLLSFLSIGNTNTGGNLAHLGGALMGYLYIIGLQKGFDAGIWIIRVMSWISNLFSRKPKMKVHRPIHQKVATSYSSHVSKSKLQKGHTPPTQEEVDRILDKIAAHGYESLTAEEKQRLADASRQDD